MRGFVHFSGISCFAAGGAAGFPGGDGTIYHEGTRRVHEGAGGAEAADLARPLPAKTGGPFGIRLFTDIRAEGPKR
jgi:hypothetical protein